MNEEDFLYLRELPAELREHSTYCPTCYESKVGPVRDAYEETLERARDVNVFYRTQGKESRFIRRTEKPLRVTDCTDKDEVVMRLAFMAAQAGYNVLVDVDLDSEKVRNGGWQTSKWSGSGVPAKVDPEKLNRKFISSPN